MKLSEDCWCGLLHQAQQSRGESLMLRFEVMQKTVVYLASQEMRDNK